MEKNGKHESQTGNGEEVGFFFRAPELINRNRGGLNEEDESPAHITFLYVGKVEPVDFSDLVDVSKRVLSGFVGPVRFELPDNIDYFRNENSWVAIQKFEVSEELKAIRKLLKDTLIECGINVEDSYDEYIPHLTIEYLPVGEETEKDPIEGEWSAFGLEIWGLPYLEYISFRIPMIYTARHLGGDGHNSKSEEEIFGIEAQKKISIGKDPHKRSTNKNPKLRKNVIETGDPDLIGGNLENNGGKDLSLKYNNA